MKVKSYYKIVLDPNPKVLTEYVEKLLDENWELVGGIAITTVGWWAQAMVKYERIEP